MVALPVLRIIARGEVREGDGGDRGCEGNDRVIERGGWDRDQLQTTERPFYVLDYISTDNSVTTFVVDQNIRSRDEYPLMSGVTLFSRAPFFEGSRSSLSFDFFALVSR